MAPVTDKRPSPEWEKELGVKVLDPDGWDRRNFKHSWNEPISREVFFERLWPSTIQVVDPEKFFND